MKIVLAFLVLTAGLLFTGQVALAASSEQIDSFNADIKIARDGLAHVDETIKYNFGDTSHHGIYRDIPIDYHDGKNTYYLTAKVQDVTMDGSDVDYSDSIDGGNLRVKIGDKDETVTGAHTYDIKYTLGPILYKKAGQLFLNLDVYGGGWTVEAKKVSASITLDNAKLSNIKWYVLGFSAGKYDLPRMSVNNVSAHMPITINADAPDGYTTNLAIANKKRPFSLSNFIKKWAWIILAIIVFAGSGVLGLIRWWVAHRRRHEQTVVPQYEPPKGMIPAGIGLIEDDKSDGKEFTATIIDWAVRGGLKIEQKQKSILGFKKKDYSLVKLKEIPDMLDFEKDLFDEIFKSGDTVEVKKMNIGQQVQYFRGDVRERLTNMGYYQDKGNVLTRGTLTKVGAQQWAKVDGFKLFLGVTQKDRLKFTDAPDRSPEQFSKFLPYAIAFGVEKQWADQFKGVDLTGNVGWYSGNIAMFSAVALSSDLSSGLGGAVASNSSFSSGGGAAGGGFGGGGGGSW